MWPQDIILHQIVTITMVQLCMRKFFASYQYDYVESKYISGS